MNYMLIGKGHGNTGRFFYFREESGTWGIKDDSWCSVRTEGRVFATGLDKGDAFRLAAVLSEFDRAGKIAITIPGLCPACGHSLSVLHHGNQSPDTSLGGTPFYAIGDVFCGFTDDANDIDCTCVNFKLPEVIS